MALLENRVLRREPVVFGDMKMGPLFVMDSVRRTGVSFGTPRPVLWRAARSTAWRGKGRVHRAVAAAPGRSGGEIMHYSGHLQEVFIAVLEDCLAGTSQALDSFFCATGRISIRSW